MHPLPQLWLCVVISRKRFVYTSSYSKCKLTHWDSVSFYVASIAVIFKFHLCFKNNSTLEIKKRIGKLGERGKKEEENWGEMRKDGEKSWRIVRIWNIESKLEAFITFCIVQLKPMTIKRLNFRGRLIRFFNQFIQLIVCVYGKTAILHAHASHSRKRMHGAGWWKCRVQLSAVVP